jgi:hypothetical protein
LLSNGFSISCTICFLLSLDPHIQDMAIWHWNASGAYDALFLGQSALWGAKELWKVCAPNKCKMFIWLILQDRVWTLEWLQRHSLDNHRPCMLCSQCVESIDHLVMGCSYSREVRFKTFRRCSWQQLTPASGDGFINWWLRSRKKVGKPRRKASDTLIILVVWCIWLQRNTRVFRNGTESAVATVEVIVMHCNLWSCARLLDRSCLFR